VTSEGEIDGEIVILNEGSTPDLYEGEITISAQFNVAGVLFIEQQGTDAPTVTVTYVDTEDGTGNICQNDVTPAEQGRVIDTTAVLIPTCTMSVINGSITDNGDADAFADTNETVDMRITVQNTCGIPLTNCVATLTSVDPKVACILDPKIVLGNFVENEVKLSSAVDVFRWKVANVDRTASGGNASSTFSAQLKVSIACEDFEALSTPQFLNMELDLDVTAPGSGPGPFIESFESATLQPGTSFTNNNMDAALNSNAAADGWRCQYSDPDWVQSNVYGDPSAAECFPGITDTQRTNVWWQIDGPTQADGGRAYTGTRSLYYGAFIPGGGHTGPTSTIEGAQSLNPINLSPSSVATLSFKMQISLVDNRLSNALLDTSWDGVTVAAQLANAAGTGVGDWLKLEAFEQPYDQQHADNFITCSFDNTDDGSTEDSYFDPTDPQRVNGPSTNCYPGFQYVWAGETGNPFSPSNTGHRSFRTDSGLQGSAGIGTWLEAKFDLSRFLGRRIRLRFMHSTHKFEGLNLWADSGSVSDTTPLEDGAWIDDVRVDNALTSPATLAADNDTPVLPNTCAANCTTANAALTATPASSSAPGQVVELNASASTLNACVSGVIQFRFLANDGTGQQIVQSWSDNPFYVDSPSIDTTYEVQVRCSSLPTCTDNQTLNYVVNCPLASGALATFPGSVSFGSGSIDSNTTAGDQTTNRNLLRFPAIGDPLAIASGNLKTVSSQVWSYTPFALAFAPAGATTHSVAGDNPTAGNGKWYLIKSAPNEIPACNQTWGAPPSTRGFCSVAAAPVGTPPDVGDACTTNANCGAGGVCSTRDSALP
jgi:hypothetical protein